MLSTRSKQKCVLTHLTSVYSTNWNLINSTYLCQTSATLPLKIPVHDTALTALQIIYYSPESVMSPKSGFSINSARFHLVNNGISPALQLKLKIASFISELPELYQKCILCSKHRHWEHTEGMNSCEEPTQDQRKLGIETIISPFRRRWCFEQITKYHKFQSNTPPLKNRFPRKQTVLIFGGFFCSFFSSFYWMKDNKMDKHKK